jgi:hypothetical protein
MLYEDAIYGAAKAAPFQGEEFLQFVKTAAPKMGHPASGCCSAWF